MADPADADPAEEKPAEVGPAEAGPAEKKPAEKKPAEAGPRRRRRLRRALVETGVIIAVAALLAGLLRTFAFQTFWIPSASMVPTLGVYDRVLVQKAFFSWRGVREGEIVVFSHPPLDNCPGPQEGDLVKRVIALPGQTIYSSGNSIYVNGRLLAEPYLPQYDPLGPPIASSQHPFRVPPGEFYVLGDNRSDSCDSRYWGPLKGSSIIGKVVLTFWHDGHPDFRRF
jgi:signal peptidase I